jgi:hypothetical protein
LTTMKRMVTAGKTDGSQERLATGMFRLSKPEHIFCEEEPKRLAMDKYVIRHPRGLARAGEDDGPNGQTPMMMNRSEQRTMTMNTAGDQSVVTCSCGKPCKNEKGLKIHRTKMGCSPILNLMQRAGSPGETEERLDPEEHHSVQHLHASENEEESSTVAETRSQAENQGNTETKQRVKWPNAAEKVKWQLFDEEVDKVLEVTLAGELDRKVKAMSTIIYNMGCERFGLEERKKQPEIKKSNRRENEISRIRGELRQLTKAYKKATREEKTGLEELRRNNRERLKILRRAENNRKKRRERTRKRAQFMANPFKFIKTLLGDKRSGRLECSKEEVEEYLRQTYGDERRNEDLQECEKLVKPEPPSTEFDETEPKLTEVKDYIKGARAASAPGPNGIPYKVYKNCPSLTRRLWKLIRVVWRRGKMPESWMVAEGCFIPKEEDSCSLKQFRTISLLNVEGKTCMAVLAKRMTSYMLSNKYIDTAVQKGGIPGVAGCIEHTSVVTQIIKEAKENNGDLTVIWLDLANAYGSIPHKVIERVLQTYYIPPKIQALVEHYFNSFRMRFTVQDYTTAWQRLEVGIVTGCTISVVLFASAMNLLVKSAETTSRGPVTATGVRMPPTRAFMDDMTITAKSVTEGRWMLEDLQKMINWARMEFKPAKSRSLVLRRGKVQKHLRFKINGQTIPTVSEQPVKSLGKWFDDTLKDKDSIQKMVKQTELWMETIEKSGLPGKLKTWCYQHGVLPRLLWPLLMYEVAITTVETMERKISQYLRRWLGVPRSLSSIGLYSTGSKLQLPLTALTEEYKVNKVRGIMMVRDSKDDKVSQAGVEMNTGRKWKAKEALDRAETRLQHKDIVGTVTAGRMGLGCITRASWKKADAAARRKLVQEEVRQGEEEDRQARAAAMKKQGSWLNWDKTRARKLTWENIWRMEGSRIRFLIRSVYDVLPSPTNLCTWGLTQDPNCKLCGQPANLEHVLTACRVALTDGSYTWRHDQVLKVIAAHLDIARRKKGPVQKMKAINFVRAGEVGQKTTSTSGLLATANDWSMQADINS